MTSEYGPAARVAVAAYSLLIYPIRVLWPAWLSPLHEMPSRAGALEPRFALAPVGVVLVTGALVVPRRRWPAGLTV